MELRGQLHVPNTLPLKKGFPGTHLIEGWVGPTAGMGTLDNRKTSCPAGYQNKIPQYTDRIILALQSSVGGINMYT